MVWQQIKDFINSYPLVDIFAPMVCDYDLTQCVEKRQQVYRTKDKVMAVAGIFFLFLMLPVIIYGCVCDIFDFTPEPDIFFICLGCSVAVYCFCAGISIPLSTLEHKIDKRIKELAGVE